MRAHGGCNVLDLGAVEVGGHLEYQRGPLAVSVGEALTAAAAFASLCASELRALRELGILAAAGEVLTAIAIVLLTPALAAAMERTAPPRVAGADRVWSRAMGAVAGGKSTPHFVLAGLAVVALTVAFGPHPRLADSVVLVRPRALAPLAVQASVFARFGGEPGQWIVIGDAPDLERALQLSETLERALAPLEARGDLAGFDTVSALAPSLSAQRSRLDAVARMDPAGAADRLAHTLSERGARGELFDPGLAALRAPLPTPVAVDPLTGGAAPLARRFLARRHGRVVFLAYVRPGRGHAGEALRAEVTRVIRGVDGSLSLTGYPLLEADVRAALRADTLRVGGIAALLVTLLLAVSLRSVRRVGLALAGVAVEILALFAFLGVARIQLDAYNLLAVPVLVGITIDEIVFVLHAYDEAEGTPAERARSAVREMTSATTATAAATAAGFLSLSVCRFDALRGLGLVAGVGTLLGLVAAIIVVP
ncbi:MAG: MMPL family transporter, partial [Deltaproteobacteria bacterium]